MNQCKHPIWGTLAMLTSKRLSPIPLCVLCFSLIHPPKDSPFSYEAFSALCLAQLFGLVVFPSEFSFRENRSFFEVPALLHPAPQILEAFPPVWKRGNPSDLPHKVSIDGIHVQTVDGEAEASLRYPVGVIITAHLERITTGSGSFFITYPSLFFPFIGEKEKNMVRNFFVNLT